MFDPKSGVSHQDWEPVFMDNTKRNAAKKAAANASRRGGGSAIAAVERKIDEGEYVAPKPISMELRQIIQQARCAKKNPDGSSMTQKQLAAKINVPSATVNGYESGKMVPVQFVLGKLERELNVRLRGKDIGEPFFKPKNCRKGV